MDLRMGAGLAGGRASSLERSAALRLRLLGLTVAAGSSLTSGVFLVVEGPFLIFLRGAGRGEGGEGGGRGCEEGGVEDPSHTGILGLVIFSGSFEVVLVSWWL